MSLARPCVAPTHLLAAAAGLLLIGCTEQVNTPPAAELILPDAPPAGSAWTWWTLRPDTGAVLGVDAQGRGSWLEYVRITTFVAALATSLICAHFWFLGMAMREEDLARSAVKCTVVSAIAAISIVLLASAAAALAAAAVAVPLLALDAWAAAIILGAGAAFWQLYGWAETLILTIRANNE